MSRLVMSWLPALCLLVAARHASGAFFVPLGHLPGRGYYSPAADVSSDGSVVVGFSGHNFGYVAIGEAFHRTMDGGMKGLGFLSGGNASSANGVSADGSVVVGFSGSTLATSPASEAFRWTSDGGLVGLGFLSSRNASSASDVSADGLVVVGRSYTAYFAGSTTEAFRWTSAGGMIGLGDLPGGDFWSDSAAISSDGAVIVGWSRAADGQEAFRWTSADGMIGLGSLPGASSSTASGVSADGSVVVGSSYTASSTSSNSTTEAFRWTSDGGMIGLGDLPGGAHWSFASDVSADGSVVVGYGESARGGEAVLWDAINGMRRVSDVLTDLGVDLTGRTLTAATAISADGATIVGYGTNPSGHTEAWLANISTVPEPSTFALIGLAFISYVARRRKKAGLSAK